MTISKLIHCFDILDEIFSVIFKERLAKHCMKYAGIRVSENPYSCIFYAVKNTSLNWFSGKPLAKKTFRKIFETFWNILKHTYERNDRYNGADIHLRQEDNIDVP